MQELSGRAYRQLDFVITYNALFFCGKHFYRNPPTGLGRTSFIIRSPFCLQLQGRGPHENFAEIMHVDMCKLPTANLCLSEIKCNSVQVY